MADITAQIRTIQQASRGEDVRDAIVSALQAINTNIESDVVAATNRLVSGILDQAVSDELDERTPSIVSQAALQAAQAATEAVSQALPNLISTEVASQVATAKTELTSELTTTLTAEITRQINEKLEDGSEVEF
jgi:hypothetical protein